MWTATVGNDVSTPVYQFSVGLAGGPLHIMKDFSAQNSFTWAPLQEGVYNVQVDVKDGFTDPSDDIATASYTVNSRVTGTNSSAVITAMSNPLVALFSAPPSLPGTMFVEYRAVGGDPSWQKTNTQAVVPGESTNFLVAGLLPNTTYQMRDVLSDGTTSALLTFTTGSLPDTVTFPNFTVPQPADSRSDLSQGMVLYSQEAPDTVNTVATDLAGHVEWYYDETQFGLTFAQATSLVPGGTILLLGDTPDFAGSATLLNDVREIDLAGDTLHETNVDAVNAQLAAMGYQPLIGLDHEAQRLPNGDTAVIGTTRRTVNINGTATVYQGNDVIVLDSNFRVKWVWDSFDHLDVNRGPTLGDTGPNGEVDWLHANAIDYSPTDGNLLVSLRSQDWVIKIDYRNGGGDGHVVWRLGQGGDFTINSADPSPWFSHQHDARYIAGTSMLTLFDDGNTRVTANGGGDSRGQVLMLNEQTRQATLALSADLGNYSFAVGSAQKLPNGNYVFTSGIQRNSDGSFFGQTIEVQPDGTPVWVIQVPGVVYRGYRVNGLYNGVVGQTQTVAAPTNLSAVEASSSQINLSWTRNSTDETGFKVLRSTDDVHFSQVGTTSAGVTMFSDVGLAANTTYYYQVVASNAFGDSAPSNTASATTGSQGQPPAAPSGLSAVAAGSSQINLSWTRNSINETGFKVLRSTDDVHFSQVETTSAGVTTFSDVGLTANTTYYYQVVASNAFGDSAPSNTASATTGSQGQPPAAPSGLNAVGVSSSQINLSWTRNSTDETNFKVLRSTDGVNFSQVGTAPAGATTFSDVGLAANTKYYYQVVASNAFGDSAPSNTASATTGSQGQPPAAPSGLRAVGVSSSQINLSWTRNSTDETNFKVLRSTDGVNFSQVGTAPAGATTFSDVGLAANTKYYYQVVASNTFGDSAPSNTASATTQNPPPPPRNTGSLGWSASRGGLFGIGVLMQVQASDGQPLGPQLDLGIWGWLTAPGIFPFYQIANVTRDAAGDVAVRLNFFGLWHATLDFDPTGRLGGQSIAPF